MSKHNKGKGSGAVLNPNTESKAEKFERLVKKRVNKAVKAIGYVGNCFAPTYQYTPEQAEKVVGALTNAVANVEAKASKTQQTTDDFDF